MAIFDAPNVYPNSVNSTECVVLLNGPAGLELGAGVVNTKVEGMTDFIAVPHTHTFMMRAPVVVEQTIRFLRTGSFAH